MPRRLATCLALLAALLALPPARAEGTVFITGPTVEVSQPVAGDLLAAAARIRVDHPVARDAALAAADVAVRGPVARDLRAAGAQVVVAARVGGDAHLAGASVRLDPGAEIAGRSWTAGGEVALLGRLGGPAVVYGGTVRIGGEVAGDLDVSAGSFELLPGARVQGRLRYASPQAARIAEGAVVTGGVTRDIAPAHGPGAQRGAAREGWQGAAARGPGLLAWAFGLLACAALWTVLLPGVALRAQAELRASPGACLLVGAAALAALPLALLMLALTIVGLPLAFALLAAAALAALAGWLVVAGTLGERLFAALGRDTGTAARRYAALAVAVVLLALAGALPVLGPAVVLLCVMAGAGALLRPRLVQRRGALQPVPVPH